MKKCSTCKQDKPLSDFWKQPNKKDGLRYSCKSCLSARHSVYRKSQSGSVVVKENNLSYRYGMSIAGYSKMCEEQNYSCAICKEDCANLLVDHSHVTGIVRGLLCHSCNVALGLFKDDSERLLRAINYLVGDDVNSQK